ncbi:MAG: hypothetical protein ACE5M4_15120 [Anaerolineales bacterium]
MRWQVWGAVAGAVLGALFHLAWHMRLTLHPFSDLLWEWGGLFSGVNRLELIGLHIGILGIHVTVYAGLGTLIALVSRRNWRARS